jgi:signal transduction histidine kinase
MSTSTGPERKKQWKIRTRLAAGLGVLFLAILALVAISHFQYLNDRRDSRLEDMQRVSQTVAASLDGQSHDLESFSLSTAVTLGEARTPINPDVTEAVRARINIYLQHLFDTYGLLRALFITDPSGRVVYDNNGTSFGLDLSDHPYITELQQGQTEYWSGGSPGVQSGEMVVTHSRAITDPEGNTTGYLVVDLLADSVASRLPEVITEPGHVSLIDKNGVLVWRSPGDSDAPIGADLTDWGPLASARASGSFVIDGEPMPLVSSDRYGALERMENLGWYVAYTLPSGAVTGGTTDLFLRDVAILGAIVLAGFVAMWVFSNQTVRPLTRLTGIAKGISEGKAEHAPSITSGGAEVVQLAETMAQMHTAIKEREDQLRVQASTIENIDHLAESLASELDLDRAIRAIIEAGVELTGADAAQFVHRDPSGATLRSTVTGRQPSLAPSVDDSIIEGVLGGAEIDAGDLQGQSGAAQGTAGASTVARSVLGVPIRTRNGTVEGALVLLGAEAHAYTAQHRRLATGLARWACIVLENAKLYSQSQELVAELEKSNAAKSDFIGIVSHELRTPITTIYGGALLLRLRRESLPPEAFNDMIVSISEEAERLHHLVEDLLAIARTEVVREPRPIDLAEILGTTVGEFATNHKRVIEVSVAAGLPPAMADASYLRQVVGNLISNADKYTDLGLPIEVSATMDDGEICVRVSDHGNGIDEAEISQAFESFYRSKDAAERATGSGLGLTVCKRLIEAMGGRIWAKNRPEGGLEVGFALRAAQHPSSANYSSGGTREPLAGKSIAGKSLAKESVS